VIIRTTPAATTTTAAPPRRVRAHDHRRVLQFRGTGRPEGTRLDFVLRDILQMRKSLPAVIAAGPNLAASSTPQGDDVAVAGPYLTADAVVIAPGATASWRPRLPVTTSTPPPPRIVAGDDGVADTTAVGDDIQVLPLGSLPWATDTVVIAPGPNGQLDSTPGNDDLVLGPDGILPGTDGAVQSVAQGDDVQLVP